MIQKTDWQKLLKQHPEANFHQSEAWARTNELIGHEIVMLRTGKTGLVSMAIKNAKRGRYIEIPAGPLLDWTDEQEIKSALEEITRVAKFFHCSFARLRPQLKNTPENREILQKSGLKLAKMHLAAEHTVILDLKKSEEELLANMRRQTRYEVRRAKKLGITVEKSNSEEIFREFHKIQSETAKRQNFVPPDLKTLLAEREAFGKNAQIYVAKTAEGSPIAYGLVLSDGFEGDYYEAASTELNRKLPGAYALLWRATKDLKKQGFERFNLYGIAPPNSPNHRYAGVTTFKTGFGGEIVEFVPAHDLIINKFKYLPNLAIETIRKKRRHL